MGLVAKTTYGGGTRNSCGFERRGEMNSKAIVLCSLCVLFGSAAVLAQESIEHLIRSVPPGESVSIGFSPQYPSLDLPAVAALADLGVEGEIVSSVSQQTPGPNYVSTTYMMRVQNVLFDRAPLPSTLTSGMSTISFTRVGGRISLQGREIITQDTTLPAFEPGAYLFLFLKRDAKDGKFVTIGGPYGAFSVQAGTIKSFLPIGVPTRDEYAGIDVATFRTLVTQAAPVSP
jgi:hypothetical protein